MPDLIRHLIAPLGSGLDPESLCMQDAPSYARQCLLLMSSGRRGAALQSLDGELLLFSHAHGVSNSRRTCAVTRRDFRLSA